MTVKLNPDGEQNFLDFHFKSGRFGKGEIVDPVHIFQNPALPVTIRRKDNRGKLHIRQNRVNITCLNNTV